MASVKMKRWLIGCTAIGLIICGVWGIRTLQFHLTAMHYANDFMNFLLKWDSDELTKLVPCSECRKRIFAKWNYLLERYGQPKSIRFKRIVTVFMVNEQSSNNKRRLEAEYEVSFERMRKMTLLIDIEYDGESFCVSDIRSPVYIDLF